MEVLLVLLMNKMMMIYAYICVISWLKPFSCDSGTLDYAIMTRTRTSFIHHMVMTTMNMLVSNLMVIKDVDNGDDDVDVVMRMRKTVFVL